MPSIKLVLSAAVLACCATAAGAVELFSDRQLGLKFSIPIGFEHAPDLVGEGVVKSFRRPPAGDEAVGTFIVVKRLGGILGREPLYQAQLTRVNAHATLSSEKWKSFDVAVVRIPEQVDGVDLVTLSAQVPLVPEAVQVSVATEATREAELRPLLQSLLSTLDGRTNWLNDRERAKLLASGISRLTVFACVLIAIVYGLLRLIFKVKRAAPIADPVARL